MNNTGSYAKIRDNLTFLKSKESLAVIDDTIDYVSKNNLSFIDGFLYFTEQQVEKKKINLINHSVKMAGFPKIKTLAEFDFEYQPSISKEQIQEFNSLRFIERQENLIFYGNSGVGKTHLATAIGVTAAQNRNSTYFVKCSELMTALHKAQAEDRLNERIKKYSGYKLLIIDKRYEKSSTVITTNINFSQWDEIFGDPMIANAIIDRLFHHATVVTIKGKSYRLQNYYGEDGR